MEILVRELTDVVSDAPVPFLFDLGISSGDSGNYDGGENTSLIDEKVEDHAIMSLVDVGTAIIVASISIIMQ